MLQRKWILIGYHLEISICGVSPSVPALMATDLISHMWGTAGIMLPKSAQIQSYLSKMVVYIA